MQFLVLFYQQVDFLLELLNLEHLLLVSLAVDLVLLLFELLQFSELTI